MKKKFCLILIVLCLLISSLLGLTGCSCSKGDAFNIAFIVNEEEYSKVEIDKDFEIELPENPTKEGFDFEGWYLDNDYKNVFDINKFDFHSLTKDLKVYAKFTISQQTITYHLDEGVNGNNPNTYTINTSDIILEDASKEGYAFGGWYTDSTFSPDSKIAVIDTGSLMDYNLYAKFTINQYTITFNTNGGSLVEPITQDYNSVVIEPTVPTKLRYEFLGWYTDDGTFLNQFLFEKMPSYNINVYAKWQIVQCLVSFNYVVEGTDYDITDMFDNAMETQIVEHNSRIKELPIIREEFSHYFLGWSNDFGQEVKVNDFVARDMCLKVIVSDLFISDVKYLNCDFRYDTLYGTYTAYIKTYEGDEVVVPVLARNFYYGWGYVDAVARDTHTSITVLKNIKLPRTLETIKSNCFYGCELLKRIELPASLKSIEGGAFSGTSIDEVVIDSVEHWCSIRFGSSASLFAGGTKLICDDKIVECVTFTNTSVQSYLFYGYQYLKKAIFDSTIKSIGYSAFENCVSLQEIVFMPGYSSASNRNILSDAFANCSSLRSIINLDYNMSVSQGAFSGCIGLEEIYFNSSNSSLDIFANSDIDLSKTLYYYYAESEEVLEDNFYYNVDNRYWGWDDGKVKKYEGYLVIFYVDGKQYSRFYSQGFEEIQLPTEPSKTGYMFIGWYKDDEFSIEFDVNEFNDKKLSANVILYASHKINEVTITFNTNGGSEIQPIIQDYGTPITEPIPTLEGYEFLGWYTDPEFNNVFEFVSMPDVSLELYANWSIRRFVVNSYTAMITDLTEYGASLKTLEVPAKLNGIKIEKIKAGAFGANNVVEELIIPFIPDSGGVSSEGSRLEFLFASSYDTSNYGRAVPTTLKKVYIVGSDKIVIGRSCFEGCKYIEEIIVDDSCQVIAVFDSAFYKTSALKVVKIPGDFKVYESYSDYRNGDSPRYTSRSFYFDEAQNNIRYVWSRRY